MIDYNKMQEAISLFCSNPYWKEFYEEAPSTKCKRHIELGFYYSHFYADKDLDKVYEEQRKIESQLDLAEWKHLLKYSGNNPWCGKCKKMIKDFGKIRH